jgi:hypothetical protein
MKELILKKSEWICGFPSSRRPIENCMGEGETRLCNDQGFMCCLGQFSLQIDPTLQTRDLKAAHYPAALKKIIDGLTEAAEEGGICNTELSQKAASINDDELTTVEQKINLLTELFAKHGYKIIVQE